MIKTDLKIEDFDYQLPDEKIARFPLKKRDHSKLLIYDKGRIGETIFSKLTGFFSRGDLLVFNNTRVIQARLIFTKPTGARVEIFCLEPSDPPDYKASLLNHSDVIWTCLIGNAKSWKSGPLEKSVYYQGEKITLRAEKIESTNTAWKIKLSWQPGDLTFAGVLDLAGLVPIPPYLNREPVAEDKSAYQTVYSSRDGSVAAPTAGFHFTPGILHRLKKNGIVFSELTLHVGAGTFRPVLTADINQHIMHSEHIYFDRSNIRDLLRHKGRTTSVGTTSARCIESIYWAGCKICHNRDIDPDNLSIDQWEDQNISPVSPEVSLKALLEYAEKKVIQEFHLTTRLMIVPGYKFHLTDRLITNFHQPKSTLLLMISAFTGNDWTKIYEYAMKNNFRFLSYGDSSLLIS